MRWTGRVVTGSGECTRRGVHPAGYVPGSLNLAPTSRRLIESFPRGPRPGEFHAGSWSEHLLLSGRVVAVNGAEVAPVPVAVGEHGHTELAATVHLRTMFGLEDGHEVTVELDAQPSKVVIGIPWRATPERRRAHRFVRKQFDKWFPGCPVVEVDTGHYPYNLAAARNLAVRRAEELGADVVIISDADSVFDPIDSMFAAVSRCSDGRLHVPYTHQLYLDAEQTKRLYRGDRAGLKATRQGNGACYVVEPAAWWRAGGQDERFSGWGGEDDQMIAAAETLIGLERHQGTCLSLHHADECRPVGTPQHRPNAELAHRYWAARGSEARMRKIIEERP